MLQVLPESEDFTEEETETNEARWKKNKLKIYWRQQSKEGGGGGHIQRHRCVQIQV